MNTIYVFCNGCLGSDWHNAAALSDEGLFLEGHVCSSHAWIPHDMGETSLWKHETYRAAYPDGFEVVYIEDVKDPRLAAAYAKYVAYSEEVYSASMDAIRAAVVKS